MAHGCKGCRYFWKAENQPGGWCRRYPPVHYKPGAEESGADAPGTPPPGEYHWPYMKPDAWCGEWKDQDTSA
jgi:hypothetical protein